MASWQRINVPEIPEFPAFAHAAVAGPQIYVAGMLGLTDASPASSRAATGAETAQALAYVEPILRAATPRSPTS